VPDDHYDGPAQHSTEGRDAERLWSNSPGEIGCRTIVSCGSAYAAAVMGRSQSRFSSAKPMGAHDDSYWTSNWVRHETSMNPWS
jgi:hypothetical protein